MNYRFEITKPNTTDFRCEIAIGAEQTFQQFHDKIVETLGFDASQMASFFTLDRYGNRVKEISLMEMSMGDGDDEEGTKTLVMDSTTIRDAINAACIELDYVYDFFSNKYLRVEYAGEYVGDSADVLPLCLFCDGELPRQTSVEEAEDWAYDKEEDDYDDSFMEEFGGSDTGSRRRGGKRRNTDDDDYLYDDDGEEDYGYSEDAYGDEYDDFNEHFESLDDYIDKI